MKKEHFKIIILGAAFFLIAGALVWGLSEKGKSTPASNELGERMVIHMSPTCGCCAVYANYVKRFKYDVTVDHHNDLTKIKNDLNIPYELWSCHTTEVDGYVVEGHIPNEAIERLLTERPDIKGIGMAGMPSGSPGMPGPKTEDFLIYEIDHDGKVGQLFEVL